MSVDLRLNQLYSWLDTYLTVARSYLKINSNTNLKLYFLVSPPDMITFHCSTSNYKNIGMEVGDFYYNGPPGASVVKPQLYYLSNSSTLTPVLNYQDYFDSTLISINPEYIAGQSPTIKATEVINMEYVNKNGDTLNNSLMMPTNWMPTNSDELVTKRYVDQLRFDLEVRLGLLESKS